MVQAFVREPILHLLLKISDNRSSWIITRQQLFPSKINKPSNERKQRHPSLQVPSYWLLEFQQFFLAEIYIHQKNSYQIKFQQGMRGGKYNKILMGLFDFLFPEQQCFGEILFAFEFFGCMFWENNSKHLPNVLFCSTEFKIDSIAFSSRAML